MNQQYFGMPTFMLTEFLISELAVVQRIKDVMHCLFLTDAMTFSWKKTAEDMERRSEDIDIHHIFPKDWCKKQKSPKITKEFYDNIINKTPLSASTNRMIGGKAPSEYLSEIQKKAGIDTTNKMDEILVSHLISANALRVDDFWGFFEVRKRTLLEAIEKAMGKKVIPEDDHLSDTSV